MYLPPALASGGFENRDAAATQILFLINNFRCFPCTSENSCAEDWNCWKSARSPVLKLMCWRMRQLLKMGWWKKKHNTVRMLLIVTTRRQQIYCTTRWAGARKVLLADHMYKLHKRSNLIGSRQLRRIGLLRCPHPLHPHRLHFMPSSDSLSYKRYFDADFPFPFPDNFYGTRYYTSLLPFVSLFFCVIDHLPAVKSSKNSLYWLIYIRRPSSPPKAAHWSHTLEPFLSSIL